MSKQLKFNLVKANVFDNRPERNKRKSILFAKQELDSCWRQEQHQFGSCHFYYIFYLKRKAS